MDLFVLLIPAINSLDIICPLICLFNHIFIHGTLNAGTWHAAVWGMPPWANRETTASTRGGQQPHESRKPFTISRNIGASAR